MADKALTRLHRITDLFVTGTELVLAPDGPDGPVLVWVSKLNAFQRGDAQRDAVAGQNRRIAALDDDSDEITLLRQRISTFDTDRLIDSILGPRSSEFYLAGRDDVHADPAWTDRLTLVERADALAEDGSHETDGERERIAEINGEYLSAVNEASETRRLQAREDFAGKDRAELLDEYVEAYRRLMGFDAFQDEYARTEAWYALRDCAATACQDGWDHTKCVHPRLLPNRAAVTELPEDLLEQVQSVLVTLNMPPASAGNSAAPRTSSASSEQPSSAEASTPSTPSGT